MTDTPTRVRIDKWLWAARFYKTRSLAAEEIARGRVQVAGGNVKPARELKVGEVLTLRHGPVTRHVVVRALSAVRGPAPVAQQLYAETAESIAAREAAAAQRRLAPEPAHSIPQGRPTKRDRRQLDAHQHGGRSPGERPHQWDDRWSASLDS